MGHKKSDEPNFNGGDMKITDDKGSEFLMDTIKVLAVCFLIVVAIFAFGRFM